MNDSMRTSYTARTPDRIDVWQDSGDGDVIISLAGTEMGGLDIYMQPDCAEKLRDLLNSVLGAQEMENETLASRIAQRRPLP